MTTEGNRISSVKTVLTFLKTGTCSETAFNSVNRGFGHPLRLEEGASLPFAGGILQHGYQCGLLWGAALAAGAQAHRRFGADAHAEARAVIAAQHLVGAFRAHYHEINCLELTETDMKSRAQLMKYFIRGGTFRCFGMSARYANIAIGEINAALCEARPDVPSPPVSCAAMLAQRLGASERHQTMAAGLAGGIGLAGGACGALGAAIWLGGMQCLEGDPGVNLWKNRAFRERVDEVIHRFLACTGHEFECAEITRQRFDDVAQHARFLANGGCQDVIAALAAK